MYDYIIETPAVLNDIIDHSEEYTKDLVAFYHDHHHEGICLIASGSSYNGCLIAKPFIRHILGIDVDNRKIFLGDCNYSNQPYTMDKFEQFVSHCENIKEIKRNFKNYERVYGIFSAYPFDKELLDFALITKNVLLFNGITIYSLNS